MGVNVKTKAIKLDRTGLKTEYYLFPTSFPDETSFIEFISQDTCSYIELTKLSEYVRWPQACFPYYINEDCRICKIKIGLGAEIEFVEVTLLPRKEYNDRLANIFNEKCYTCRYSNNWHIEVLEHGGNNINLDGKCDMYQKLDSPRKLPKPTSLKIRYW